MSYKARTVTAQFRRGGMLESRYSHEFAIAERLPFSVVSDMNDPAVSCALQALDVDILLVCVCKNILKRDVLGVPKLAAINIHPSLLPKYRGPVPTFWMLLNGEQTTGATFHVMTPQIDDGDIISQFELPLDSTKSEQQIEANVFCVAAAKVEGILHEFATGVTKLVPQSPERATYFSYPTPQQRRQVRQLKDPRDDTGKHLCDATLGLNEQCTFVVDAVTNSSDSLRPEVDT